MGYVKLAALMGVLLGFPQVFVTLFVGIVIGGVTTIILLATRKRGRKNPLPMAPFLIIGLAVAAFARKAILGWYLAGYFLVRDTSSRSRAE